MPPCHIEVLGIRSSRRPWSSHRSSTLRVSSTERLICPLLCEIMSPWSRLRRTTLRSNRPITLSGIAGVSCDATPSVNHPDSSETTTDARDSESAEDHGGPQVQHGAGCPEFPVPQTEEGQTVSGCQGDSTRAAFGANCGADRRRASDRETADTCPSRLRKSGFRSAPWTFNTSHSSLQYPPRRVQSTRPVKCPRSLLPSHRQKLIRMAHFDKVKPDAWTLAARTPTAQHPESKKPGR